MLGRDRNGQKSSRCCRRAAGCPLSAAARMKTNGAERFSSQAEKHRVRVAPTRLFPPPTRHNMPKRLQESHRRLSHQSAPPSPVGRNRRATIVFTSAADSHTTTKAASVWPEEGQSQDVTFDLPVSSQTPPSRSSSAVTSCSRVESFVSPPDLSALTLTLSLAHSLCLPLSFAFFLLGISGPLTRMLMCIYVYQTPTWQRISDTQCKERDFPVASLFHVFTAA